MTRGHDGRTEAQGDWVDGPQSLLYLALRCLEPPTQEPGREQPSQTVFQISLLSGQRVLTKGDGV